MRKRDELADPASCLNKADDDEWLFVLLGRDRAAPNTVRFWVRERIRLGDDANSPKLAAAMRWADLVQTEQRSGE